VPEYKHRNTVFAALYLCICVPNALGFSNRCYEHVDKIIYHVRIYFHPGRKFKFVQSNVKDSHYLDVYNLFTCIK
jgi:hypothetical protein